MNLTTLLVGTSAVMGMILQTQAFVHPSLHSRSKVVPNHARSAVAVQVNGGTSTTSSSSSSSSPGAVVEEDYLWQIRLNVFEKAKTVTSICTSGTLCTVSNHEGIQGAPFGSFVDYVLDDDGNPVLLMNEMSMHTMNIEKNALNNNNDDGSDSGSVGASDLVTLFTQLTGSSATKKGQDVGRCSLTCKVEKIPASAADMDALRMRYSIAHVYADQVMDSPKFAFYRLVPERIYYVGGFGVMAKWVDVEDYKDAAPDILAMEADEIVAKLNREYKEDLLLTAKHLLEVETEVQDIRVSNVDRLGMDVRVTCQQKTRRNKLSTDEYRIGFRIPVISVEDAKSEILKIFQEAWEKGNGINWGDEEEIGSTVPVLKIAADNLE